MKINFDTDRLIVLEYPVGAGGKFISWCLNISEFVLPQEKDEAQSKMDCYDSYEDKGLKILKDIERTKTHKEYGCIQMANFSGGHLLDDIKADKKRANDLFKKLTNQSKYYFCFVSHWEQDAFKRYKNKKIIRLINNKEIMEKRNLKYVEMKYDHEPSFRFDMRTIQNKIKFKKQMQKLFIFLNLILLDEKRLDELRCMFIKTCKIGFEKEVLNAR